MRVRPLGADFRFQTSRKPCRCQLMNVSGLTTVRVCRQGKSLESTTGSTWQLPEARQAAPAICEGKDSRRPEYSVVEG